MDLKEKMKVMEIFIERMVNKGIGNLNNDEMKELLAMENELASLQQQVNGGLASEEVDNSYRKDFFINLQHVDDGVEKVWEIKDICLKLRRK